MTHPRLTRYELELVDVLWRLGEGTVQDVCNGLERELAYTTVMTTLRLLESRKGVLERVKRGRAYVYRPLVTRDEVSRSVLADLKDVLFRENLPSLMLNLLEEEDIDEESLNTLKKALGQIEQRNPELE